MRTISSIPYAKRLAVCLAILASMAAVAQANHYETTVEVGKTKTRSLRRELSGRPRVTVDKPGIVEAKFNSSQNALTIKGLNPGTVTVTFSGDVRVFNTGIPSGRSIPVEGSRPVSDTIEVTVVAPERPKPKPVPAPAPIEGNKTVARTARVGAGISFSLGAVAEFTRNIEVASSDPRVATVSSGTNFVVVNPRSEGECTIVFKGQAKNPGGQWQPFVRRIDLTVTPRKR
ncbi:MAG TPA: hypothetical protein VFY29_16210 [Terriglobia bacterium]|nr:hypothetical protein [Terriglobia bacterium]